MTALYLLPLAFAVWLASGRGWARLAALLAGSLLGPAGLLLASALPLLRRGLIQIGGGLTAAARADAVRRAVPALLTDLAMSAEAGLPLHTALRDASAFCEGPLADSLGRFADATQRGASVAAALEALRRELKTPQTDRLIGLLSRDAQLGLPLAASVARYRRNWLSDARRDADRTRAYLPYVFTAAAGLLLLEGVALAALPWFLSLLRVL